MRRNEGERSRPTLAKQNAHEQTVMSGWRPAAGGSGGTAQVDERLVTESAAPPSEN